MSALLRVQLLLSTAVARHDDGAIQAHRDELRRLIHDKQTSPKLRRAIRAALAATDEVEKINAPRPEAHHAG